jgi:phosphoglycolate phosphatase
MQGFPIERVVELSMHQRKPDVKVLLEVCERERVMPSESAYVGDSIARDILMAKEAGVFSIWAAYGARHDPEMYDKLVRISHWTPEDVERERELRLRALHIKPDFIVENSFSDVLFVLDPRVRSRSHADSV